MSASSFLRRLFGLSNGEIHHHTSRLVSLCESLLSEHGEITGVALAREALACYQTLGEREREEFFDVLAKTFSPSPDAVGQAADAYRADPTPENLIRAAGIGGIAARRSCSAVSTRRLARTAALVEMRRLILKGIATHPQWKVLDNDLLKLLRSWFNRGFLRMERIDWHTPAIVLEKLMQYEAVHAIQGWGDLRRRLEADRRCFAFFHPQLPDEPLVFIEVALTRGMSARVQPLLEVGSSVCRRRGGQRDVLFDHQLPGRAARHLVRQPADQASGGGAPARGPAAADFATLSPIPGFRRWLEVRARLAIGPHGEARVALLQRIEEPGWHEAASVRSARESAAAALRLVPDA